MKKDKNKEEFLSASKQDSMFLPVLKWLVSEENTKRHCSIAGIQRQFGLGFARASRLVDKMCEMGFVSEFQEAVGRMVIISKEEVDALFG